jgi:hypothetical protein
MRRGSSTTRASRAGLWFGLLGGASAWTFHLMSAYLVAEFGCAGGLAGYDYLGVTLVAWLELALTAATAFIASLATIAAWRSFHRSSMTNGKEDAEGSAERNTAWAGVLTSGIFTFIIIFESIPILFYLQAC